jgi:hypothetical protein
MILFATILVLKTLGYKIAWYWYLLALTEFCHLKINVKNGSFNLIKVVGKDENNKQG